MPRCRVFSAPFSNSKTTVSEQELFVAGGKGGGDCLPVPGSQMQAEGGNLNPPPQLSPHTSLQANFGELPVCWENAKDKVKVLRPATGLSERTDSPESVRRAEWIRGEGPCMGSWPHLSRVSSSFQMFQATGKTLNTGSHGATVCICVQISLVYKHRVPLLRSWP